MAVFDAFVWATQVADQNQVFSGSPNVEGTVSRTFAAIVSRLVPSGTEQTGFSVDQTGASLDIVQTQADLPIPRAVLILIRRD
jgi:hypothetical protein